MAARGALAGWLRGAPLRRPADLQEAAALVAEAARQGVAALLHEAALGGRRGPDEWPAEALEALRAQRLALVARAERQQHLARRLAPVFVAAGTPALVLKGAALVPLYGAPELRPMADLDVLVLSGWRQALERLLAEGFVALERGDHAWALRAPEGLVVELHHAWVSAPGLFPCPRALLWAAHRDDPAGGLPRPGAEDLLVQLALHAAFQHGLSLRLVQWLDFKLLLGREPLDAARLLERARRSRAERALAWALAAADAIVGCPVPPALRAGLPASRPGWLEAACAEPLRLVAPSAPGLARVRFALCAGRRVALVAHSLRGSGPWPRPSAALRRVVRLAGHVLVPRRLRAGEAA